MLWHTGTLTNKPKFELGGWTVVETARGQRHLVGIDLATGSGQVSSAIQSFDPATMPCVTRSGRIYELLNVGEIRTDNAWYVWEAWCKLNSVLTWTDVSNEYRAG